MNTAFIAALFLGMACSCSQSGEKANGPSGLIGAGGGCTMPMPSLPEGPGCMAPDLTMDDSLRSIAANYANWHRVDEWNHWAPADCRLRNSSARSSASTDADTHGGKLYYLYAKDRAAYMASATQDQPIGQVIVKESFQPVEVPASDVIDATKQIGGHGFAERDGKLWKPGENHGLFVMMKLVPGAGGTDNGWMYATTNADGTVVHESGRIASCMGCHETGTRDRMFGLKD